jgi:uncharacterized protein
MGTGSSPSTAGHEPGSGRAAPAGLRRRARCATAALAFASLLAASPARAGDPALEPLERFPQAALAIASGDATHRFRVWVADTEARHNQGLMFVKSLAPNRGMVFAWQAPQVASFWMKNTFIPLDLLFVGPDGRVIRIVENAVPQSVATISSMGLVIGVVELAGGSVTRLGIHPGDRVHCSALSSR